MSVIKMLCCYNTYVTVDLKTSNKILWSQDVAIFI